MHTHLPKLSHVLPIIEDRSARLDDCLDRAVEVARPDGLLESNHLLYAILETLAVPPEELYQWGLNPDNVLDEIQLLRRFAGSFFGESPHEGASYQIKIGSRSQQFLSAAAEWANLQGSKVEPEHLLVALLIGSPSKGGGITMGSMAESVLKLNDMDFNRDDSRARDFAGVLLPDLAEVIKKK